MPCSTSDYCGALGTGNGNIACTFPRPGDATMQASMGWVGYVKMRNTELNLNTVLRVTSANVNQLQEITKPDVLDGRIDPSVYQIGPRLNEGSMSMPLIADSLPTTGSAFNEPCPEAGDATAGSLVDKLFCWATARNSQGRLIFDNTEMIIRYANHGVFRYNKTIVNTMGFSVSQQDVVTVDFDVISQSRDSLICGEAEGMTAADAVIPNFLAPARIFTWADTSVSGFKGQCHGQGKLFGSHQVREFSFEINNNADRYYALNGSLFPTDTNVGKREITGSITTLGIAQELRKWSESNQDRFTAKGEIALGLFVGADTHQGGGVFQLRDYDGSGWPASTPVFEKFFKGVVFEIPEMELGNDVFETTLNWHSMANDQECYVGISPQSSFYFPAWGP